MNEKIQELENLITGQREHLDKCISKNSDEQNQRHSYIIMGVMDYVNGMEKVLGIVKGESSQTIEEAIEERQLKMKKDEEEHPEFFKMICNPLRVIIFHDNQYLSGIMKAIEILK